MDFTRKGIYLIDNYDCLNAFLSMQICNIFEYRIILRQISCTQIFVEILALRKNVIHICLLGIIAPRITQIEESGHFWDFRAVPVGVSILVYYS